MPGPTMPSTTRLKHTLGVVAALLLPSTLAQTPAPPTSGNPPGVQYVAALSGSLSGSVVASSSANGSGVEMQINVLGLPAGEWPFCESIYPTQAGRESEAWCVLICVSIVVYYLTPSTNCSGDPPVLDPYKARTGTGCNQKSPQNCAVGDLWRKHGKMEGTSYSTKYVHQSSATQPRRSAI